MILKVHFNTKMNQNSGYYMINICLNWSVCNNCKIHSWFILRHFGDADDQCLYLNDKTQMDMYLYIYILETACLDICSLH